MDPRAGLDVLDVMRQSVLVAQRLAEASEAWAKVHDESRSFAALLSATEKQLTTAQAAQKDLKPTGAKSLCAVEIETKATAFVDGEVTFRSAYVAWLEKRQAALSSAMAKGVLKEICGDAIKCDDEPSGPKYAVVTSIECTAPLFLCGGQAWGLAKLVTGLGMVSGHEGGGVTAPDGGAVALGFSEPTWAKR